MQGLGSIDPQIPTRDAWSYQRYIQKSKAEFGIAKHGYVITRSGWFSERSANYLASGRPVLVQDTGFSSWLETGLGVVAFTTPDEALAGIEDISARYDVHCGAARDIAVAYFDSLRRLFDASSIGCSIQVQAFARANATLVPAIAPAGPARMEQGDHHRDREHPFKTPRLVEPGLADVLYRE